MTKQVRREGFTDADAAWLPASSMEDNEADNAAGRAASQYRWLDMEFDEAEGTRHAQYASCRESYVTTPDPQNEDQSRFPAFSPFTLRPLSMLPPARGSEAVPVSRMGYNDPPTTMLGSPQQGSAAGLQQQIANTGPGLIPFDTRYDNAIAHSAPQTPMLSYAPRANSYGNNDSSSDVSSTRRLMTGTPVMSRLGTPAPTNRSHSSLGVYEAQSPGSPALYSPHMRLGLLASPGLSVASRSPDPSSPSAFTSTQHAFNHIDEKGRYYAVAGPATSTDILTKFQTDANSVKRQKERQYGTNRRRKYCWSVGAILFVLAAAAGGVVAVFMIRKNQASTASTPTSATESVDETSRHREANTAPEAPRWGADGSIVLTSNGSSFTYHNSFGGFWVSEPYNNSARAQSWSKSLAEQWDYSADKIYGVNLGGWLTVEPFIAPSLFEPYEKDSSPVLDEWMLSQKLGEGLESTLTQHYETFITEQDFAQIAAAGLNWVRIALPYWAIETYSGEPFLHGVSWRYFLKAIAWARKYGLRINLDLHTIPGSQNGWNHSGRFGTINFLNGVMGLANAQRTLNYIRVLTEFINQPEISPVVPMFGIINEPWTTSIGSTNLRSFYMEAYEVVRSITGIGAGKGPIISIHDGFNPDIAVWEGFMAGADRVALDSHKYHAFATPNNRSISEDISVVCNTWAGMFNKSLNVFGITTAGEWSLAMNDCGQYLNGVDQGVRYEGTYPQFTTRVGSCADFVDAVKWDDVRKAHLQDLALAYMDSFTNWFFWTWKIGRSSKTGSVPNPVWSYQYGLELGYMPKDPRAHVGACTSQVKKYNNPAVPMQAFKPPLRPSATGGGNGRIAAAQMSSYGVWPPATMQNAGITTTASPIDAADLPLYTATGHVLTLMASPSITSPIRATPVATTPYYTPINDCNYPDAWNAAGGNVDATAC